MYNWFFAAGLIILGIFIYYITNNTDHFFVNIASMIMILVGVVWFSVTAILSYSHAQSVSVYKSQMVYMETHVTKNEIEDAALTQKKVELNAWLFSAQYSKKNLGNFSLYPNEVLELEPIQ